MRDDNALLLATTFTSTEDTKKNGLPEELQMRYPNIQGEVQQENKKSTVLQSGRDISTHFLLEFLTYNHSLTRLMQ